MIVTLAPLAAFATPMHSLLAGSSCDGCHVEPVGWHNPDRKSERRCTLDCSGCHVVPFGGGLRTPSGQYYGREVLPTWGERPSTHAEPATVAPDVPTKGHFDVRNGFSGWWPGAVWVGDVPDRYGEIDPEPNWLLGLDARVMTYAPTDGRPGAIFPMQASFYGWRRLSYRWSVLLDGGLASSRAALNVLPDGLPAEAAVLQYAAVRQALVLVDRLPSNAWVLAGRFAPAYGWKIPNHTAYVRRNLGFDQDRGVFGVASGIVQNDLWGSVAVFGQGFDGWPGDAGDRGQGATAVAGVRRLGWQAQGSVAVLRRPEGDDELVLGPSGGLNLSPVAILLEADLRRRGGVTSLYTLTGLQWDMVRGLSLIAQHDWTDANVRIAEDHLQRLSLGADWRPVAHTAVEVQGRHAFAGGGLAAIGSAPAGTEVLVLLHAWW